MGLPAVLSRWLWIGLAGFVHLSIAAVSADAERPHVVMLVAEREYRTDESLSDFSEQHRDRYRTTMVQADPDDRNRLVGLDALDSADVLIVSVRRRTLPAAQLDTIRRYVASGKPVIGIRTASHAFSLRNAEPDDGRAMWPEFDSQVFGGHYTNHHGNALKATIDLADTIPPQANGLVEGLSDGLPTEAGGSLYRVSPVNDRATVLLRGKVEGHPEEPIAWTFVRDDGGKSFYTSLGHVDDFKGPVLPKLLTNAIDWSLEK